MGGTDGMDLVASIRDQVEQLEGIPPSLQNALDDVFSRAEAEVRQRAESSMTDELNSSAATLPIPGYGGNDSGVRAAKRASRSAERATRARQPAPRVPPAHATAAAAVVASDSAAGEAANDLRALEGEVNVAAVEALCGEAELLQVLAVQVAWLLACVDRHAACERWAGAGAAAVPPPGVRLVRGRHRAKPSPALALLAL